MRKSLVMCLAGLFALSSCVSDSRADTTTSGSSAELSIPFVPTRHDVVKDLLWLANVGKDDVVYDLGSGDGRIVIAAAGEFGARRAIGIEIDQQRVRKSGEAAKQAGMADRVQFIEGDLFAQDFSEASVVVIYLGHGPNVALRSKLFRTLKPGARVVSHQFGMGEWPADKMLRVRTQYLGMYGVHLSPFADNPRVPDYRSMDDVATNSTVRVWIVPAAVAGVWRGKVAMADGERELKLVLHQRIEGATGEFHLGTSSDLAGGLRADLWGDQLRFDCSAAGRSFLEFHMMFDGKVAGDTMEGTLAIFEGDKTRELPWKGQRDKSRFTGTWEWASATSARPVQLRIERHEGQLVATYTDRERTLPVGDIYDFGGGFYLTHLVGRDADDSIAINDDTGWLIGEAIADGDGLAGTIEFYPYPGQTDRKAEVPEGLRVWRPNQATP